MNYEAQGPPDVLMPHSNEDSNLYETLDQSKHDTTRKGTNLEYQQKLITFALLTLLCLVLFAVVALLGMRGYSLHARESLSQSMETVAQNLSQLLSRYESRNNSNETCKQVIGITNESVKKLINITNALSDHANTSTSIATVVDNILLMVKELLSIEYNSHRPPTSCKEAKERNPRSQSGEYLLNSTNGTSNIIAYCYMDELCGSGGGWTRLAYLNMSDSTQNCPSGFRLYQSGGVRACGRPVTNDSSCPSVQFQSNGIRYSQICGRVVGYQYGTTNAFHKSKTDSIKSVYLDGISITRGPSYQHVWSLVAGIFEV